MAGPLDVLITSAAANWMPGVFGDPVANMQRQDTTYNTALAGLNAGQSLKEQGYSAKDLEGAVGVDRAAHLMGLEKTDYFSQQQQGYQQQQQNQQFLRQVTHGLQSRILAPNTQTDTPEEASGFYPRLSGPGISGPAQVATAGLTQPTGADFESRIAEMKPGAKTILFGQEVPAAETQRISANASQKSAETALQRLNDVEVPTVGIERQKNRILQQQANTSARDSALGHVQDFWGDQLNLMQQRKAADWLAHLGPNPGASIMTKIGLPTKGKTGSGLTPPQALKYFDELEESGNGAVKWRQKQYDDAKALGLPAPNVSKEDAAAFNDSDVTSYTRRLAFSRSALLGKTTQPDDVYRDLEARNHRFANPAGGKGAPLWGFGEVGTDDKALGPTKQLLKDRVRQTLGQDATAPSGATGLSKAGEAANAALQPASPQPVPGRAAEAAVPGRAAAQASLSTEDVGNLVANQIDPLSKGAEPDPRVERMIAMHPAFQYGGPFYQLGQRYAAAHTAGALARMKRRQLPGR